MSPKESSRLYVVRRGGKVHFEGDLASLRAWLADNRINSDDEVRKQGLEVLEGERLWSLVRERLELGFDPASERESLRRQSERNRAMLAAGAIALFAGLFMLVLTQLLPRLDAAKQVSVAEENGARIAREIGDRLQGEIDALRKSLSNSEAELVAARDAVNRTSERKPGVRMVSLIDPASPDALSIVPLFEWVSSSGIRATLGENRQSFRLVEDGGDISCSGTAETGVYLSYSRRFTYSHSKDEFADFLTTIILINSILKSGKVVILSDTEIEYRFTSVVAVDTPATVIETFLLECKLGSSAAKGGLKQFIR